MSADHPEVADVYAKFSTKGPAARYRDKVETYSLFDVIGLMDGRSVLDVGCGYGRPSASSLDEGPLA
ncbi:hypothetical protein [Saccharopolyspora pogona]|uniref:hypothetical protein n=1 Tax=Saccharopolyspora pogona TaxID=333966 RepID=UPI001688904F|nr:hypothetical protein [Saccharopolyspora pogona]